jgi:zinc protease
MLLLALCCLAAASLPAQVRPVEHYRQITSPPPRSIERPDLERLVLDNGLVVYLLPDAELPLVGASAMIPVGSRWEPVAKAGLAELVGTVMRTGGTPMRNGDKLDEDLDSLGASIELFVAEDSATAMVSALKENSAMALEVLADLLQNPAFPQDKIDLAKVNQRDNVARRNDFPPMIGFREFAGCYLARIPPTATKSSMPRSTPSAATIYSRSTNSSYNPRTSSWPFGATLGLR